MRGAITHMVAGVPVSCHADAVEVIRLGAFADVLTEGEYRAHLRSSPLSDADTEEALEAHRHQVDIDIEEFAVLADGRRVVFDERGLSSRAHLATGEASAEQQLSWMTAEEVERLVRITVLDDDDGTEHAETHDPAWVAARLRGRGVDVAPASLAAIPYEIVLSDRLRDRLGG
jgi:hypothetical protein